ncbi:alpha-ketoacid dehydrogenase subunit beta [Desulfovibrio inopinatus]|uniref:alpha-ketoacid dehydrogenase subunit beta n=1 Tax=Desulfovibrio inopinatus TaxID=102109 RepID=UPI000410387C|nr:alpha-ketoacid dehydrogenase subunit beta [Desulfovibrio inopinatus]
MRQITYCKALNEALDQCMAADDAVVLLGEDIGQFGGVFQVTAGLMNKYGKERVVDVPIAEAGFVGAGVGAALTGMRPVVEIMFMDFTTVCMDMIVNQMAKMHYMFGGRGKVPMVLRTNIGAGRGTAAQHSQSLQSWFMQVPGLYVAAPATPYDAKGLLIEAIRNDNPVMFVEHKKLYITKGDVPEEDYTVPFGKAAIRHEGSDITIVATLAMVQRALDAAKLAAEKGISVEVIDPRTLVPLDKETILNSVKKTGKVIVSDEGHKTCGAAAEISAIIAEEAVEYLKAPVVRVCSPDTPVPFSPPLEQAFIPDVKDLMPAIERLAQY